MKIYTIGYGGRKPQELLDLLTENGIRAVVDVRLRPDRSSMGTYAKARSNTQGIEGLLTKADIQYFSFVELGNIFMDLDDWAERYRSLIEQAGDILTGRLWQVPVPFCLMCAEKHAIHCPRLIVAEYLKQKGHDVKHIE